MEIKNQEAYDSFKSKNSNDLYGNGILQYAEYWAYLMEKEIKAGKKLEEIASKTSEKADTTGITGAMYNSAIKMLSICWKHGDDLKEWHNKKHGYEGEGVLNTTVVSVPRY